MRQSFSQLAVSLLLATAPAMAQAPKSPLPKQPAKPSTLDVSWNYKRRLTTQESCYYSVSAGSHNIGILTVQTHNQEFILNKIHIDKKDPKNGPAMRNLLNECSDAQKRQREKPAPHP